MGRKSSAKKMRWFESFECGGKGLSNRHYLRIMVWAGRRGIRVKSRVTDHLRSELEPVRGGITFLSFGDRQVKINDHRIELYKRYYLSDRQKKRFMFEHKRVADLPLTMVMCHPHVERAIRKTMPRGQAFDRLMKMEVEHA